MADAVPRDQEHSFMLLDLAPEILDMILAKYYEDTTLAVGHLPKDPQVTGMPSLNIEQTCKQLRDQSLKIRNKHTSRKLVAENNRFLAETVPIFCQSAKFVWSFYRGVINWKQVMTGFPRLQDLEFQLTQYRKHSVPCTQSYMPLDEKNQRRLARDVVTEDWDSDRAIDFIKRELLVVEETFYGIRDVHAHWRGFGSFKSLEDELNIKVILSTISVDDQGRHFYCATTTYKSEGVFDGDYPWRDFGLTALFKKCQVGTVVEVAGVQVEEKEEEDFEDLRIWDDPEGLT